MPRGTQSQDNKKKTPDKYWKKKGTGGQQQPEEEASRRLGQKTTKTSQETKIVRPGECSQAAGIHIRDLRTKKKRV